MHTIAIVLVRSRDRIEDEVSELLAPYSEHIEVDPYGKRCECIEVSGYRYASERFAEEGGKERRERERFELLDETRAIESEALEVARDYLGDETPDTVLASAGNAVASLISMIERKERPRQPVLLVGLSRYSRGIRELERDRRLYPREEDHFEPPERLAELAVVETAWADRWFAYHDGWDRRYEALREAAPDFGKPRPDCELCGGSGIQTTTWNPQAKYDYWMIGGGWTNFLGDDSYEPAQDPRNWDICWLCEGSGMREDELGRSKRAADPSFTCNGCSHDPGPPGTSLKSPSAWVNVGNIAPAATWLELIEAGFAIPAAVITPDGKWHHEPGRAFKRRGSAEIREWEEKVKSLASRHRHSMAVAVDYHH